MVSEEERLKREIRIVKEVIAQRETRKEVGYSNWREMEQEISIPPRYEHLIDQQTEVLESHLERLEEDLSDLKKLNGDFNNNQFRKESEFRRGKRRDEEDEE